MNQNKDLGAAYPIKTGMQSKKTRQKKVYDWLNNPYKPVRGETALWVAVITQAMMDALSRAQNSEAQYHKHEAIRWLTGNSRDFVTVCLFAGMDPNYVRRKAKRTLASPMPWRAEAGKGNRYLERKAYRKKLRQVNEEPQAAEQALLPCLVD